MQFFGSRFDLALGCWHLVDVKEGDRDDQAASKRNWEEMVLEIKRHTARFRL